MAAVESVDGGAGDSAAHEDFHAPESEATRQAFDGIKGAVAETYFSSEAGMKELGWNGRRAFAPPSACG